MQSKKAIRRTILRKLINLSIMRSGKSLITHMLDVKKFLTLKRDLVEK